MSARNFEFLDALAAVQKTTRGMLHQLDTDDVAISREALSALSKAARDLLAKFMGPNRAQALSQKEIVRLFASRLYWNEAGGELIMCAEVDGRAICLPIPAEHWNVNAPEVLQ